jgi:hypothetical protein
MKVSESDEISSAEWQALEKKYANASRTISAIISGPAVAFLDSRKKRAKRAGSRGSYISSCIVFYEKHLGSKKTLLEEAREEAFRKGLRIFYLERLLRDENIPFDAE